jgi:hypothetical protein
MAKLLIDDDNDHLGALVVELAASFRQWWHIILLISSGIENQDKPKRSCPVGFRPTCRSVQSLLIE